MQTGLRSQGTLYLQQNLALTTRQHLKSLIIIIIIIIIFN